MQAREIIEKWRVDNKKSQGDMASLLGLNSQQNYNDLKTGRTKKISVEIAAKFKKLSGINILDSRKNSTTVSREIEEFELWQLKIDATIGVLKAEVAALKQKTRLSKSFPDALGQLDQDIQSAFQRKVDSLNREE